MSTGISYGGDLFRNVQFFIGVVEQSDGDPLGQGRVKVRAHGIHSHNPDHVKTEHLPWATPLCPITSASTSGVGVSPVGVVNTTWVVGFFADGDEMQMPFIIGTFYGDHISYPSGAGGDRTGNYPNPQYQGTNHVNFDFTNTGGLTTSNRYLSRIRNVPVAVPPVTKSVRDLEGTEPTNEDPKGGAYGFYDRPYWNEPIPRAGGQGSKTTSKETNGLQSESDEAWVDNSDPLDWGTGSVLAGAPEEISIGHGSAQKAEARYQPWQYKTSVESGYVPREYPAQSMYPYNGGFSTRSGHLFEWDDTPGGERISQYHTKGTFTEVVASGSRTTKVVGDDFEVVMRGKHMLVQGNMNITVQGDARILTEGNHYQEVGGNYYLNVHGDMVTKIQGNEQKVVVTDKSTQINKNERKRISNNHQITIEGTNEVKIVGTSNTIHQANVQIVTDGWVRDIIRGSLTMFTGANCNITVGSADNANLCFDANAARVAAQTGRFNLKTSANINVETSENFNVDATANITFDTADQFLVGRRSSDRSDGATPANTVITSDRIDLNP